jgi:hypothetical protein
MPAIPQPSVHSGPAAFDREIDRATEKENQNMTRSATTRDATLDRLVTARCAEQGGRQEQLSQAEWDRIADESTKAFAVQVLTREQAEAIKGPVIRDLATPRARALARIRYCKGALGEKAFAAALDKFTAGSE